MKYITLISLFFIVSFSFSQSGTVRLDSYDKIKVIKENGEISKIQFLDTITGEKINEFDVIGNNPYSTLLKRFSEKNKREQDLKMYKLSFEDTSKLSRNYFLSKYDMFSKMYLNKDKINITYSDYNSSVALEYKNYAIIIYTLFAYNDWEIVGIRSTAIILNEIGIETSRLNHLDVDIRHPTITENGKFFSFLYGGAVDEEGCLISPGHRLYDLTNEEIIIDFKAKDCTSEKYLLPARIEGSSLIISSFDYRIEGNKFCKMRIIDPENRKYFYKDFSLDELGLLKKITNEGFEFWNPEKEKTIFIHYEKDFKLKEF